MATDADPSVPAGAVHADVTTPRFDELLAANARYAETFAGDGLSARPRRALAIVACMDARLHVEAALGLDDGDAHVIRNAGGLATDDAIRSLAISRHLLGTEEILLIEHTQCGLLGLRDDEVRKELDERSGERVDLALGGFDDLEANVRAQVERIRSHPWTRGLPVHGLLFEVETGRLRTVV